MYLGSSNIKNFECYKSVLPYFYDWERWEREVEGHGKGREVPFRFSYSGNKHFQIIIDSDLKFREYFPP